MPKFSTEINPNCTVVYEANTNKFTRFCGTEKEEIEDGQMSNLLLSIHALGTDTLMQIRADLQMMLVDIEHDTETAAAWEEDNIPQQINAIERYLDSSCSQIKDKDGWIINFGFSSACPILPEGAYILTKYRDGSTTTQSKGINWMHGAKGKTGHPADRDVIGYKFVEKLWMPEQFVGYSQWIEHEPNTFPKCDTHKKIIYLTESERKNKIQPSRAPVTAGRCAWVDNLDEKVAYCIRKD